MLIDRDGLEAFSTRKLGAILGVEAMSLYHHFPSKGQLLDAVVDRMMSDVVVPDEPAENPKERFRQAVLSYCTVARAHPNAFLLLAARRFNTPTALAFLEALLVLFQGAGLSPERAARHFRLMGYFLNGALLAEQTVRGQRPDATGSVVDTGVPMRFPATAQSAPYLGTAYLDATFSEGLELLLEHLAQEVASTKP